MEEKDIKKEPEVTEPEIVSEENKEEVVEIPTPEQEQEVIDKPYYEVIEDERNAFFKTYSRNRKFGNILMFATVLLAVGVMLMVTADTEKYPYLPPIGWSIAGAAVIGMLVYFFITKKKQPEKGQHYINTVVQQMNNALFKDNAFSDLVFDTEAKLSLEDLVGDGVYKDASQIRSRNVVRGIYNGHHFLYGEAALLRQQISRKQQTPPLFVGKYISMPNELEFDGRFILVNKNAKQPLDLPNDIEDLVILEEKEEFVVYGPKDSSFRKYLRKEVVSAIEGLVLDTHLLNVNIVFWKGHSAAYLSYDDTAMSVPFDKPFDHNAHDKSVRDLRACFKALSGK